MSRMRRLATSTVVPVVIAVAAGAVWMTVDRTGTGDSPAAQETGRPLSAPQVVEGLEVAPTQTITDWAKIADHVVTASVLAERAIDQQRSETSTDSQTLVFREVTLKIEDRLWSAPSAAKHELPVEVVIRAMGWNRTEGDVRQELAPSGGSRLEIGHSYVVALAWVPATCGEDGDEPGQWATIGAGGTVPADHDVIGAGEFEGTSSKSARGAGPDSVLERFRTEQPGAVALSLRKVPPGTIGVNKVGQFDQSGSGRRCG